MSLIPVSRGLMFLALALGACSSGPASPESSGGLPLRLEPLTVDGTLVGERYSGLTTRERLVVRDDAAWASLWSQITAHVQPTPALPAVDFGREQLIVVSSGTKPTGGYGIDVAEVREAEGALHVVVRETAPGDRCMTTAALTAPVAVVRVPRSDARIVFEERQVTVDCD